MSVQVDIADDLRRELDALGERRKAIRTAETDLRAETREVLRRCVGVIPMVEAAKRANLNRSTVYELYLGDVDERNDEAARADTGAADGGPAAS